MSVLEAYLGGVSLLTGLVIGSFLNVVISRLPAGESLVRPASRCPNCGHPVRYRDNIPLLGWVMLRGRCRDCREPISARYPLVEAVTASLFLLTYLVVGAGPELLLGWAFLSVLVVVAFIDLDHYIIPNRIVIPAALVGLVVSVALHPERWWEFPVAGLAAAGFLAVIGLIWPGGMGFGDVKMALMMGTVLGRLVLVALFLAFLFGGLTGLILLGLRLKDRKDRIPFGPYLALGAGMGFLAGEQMLKAYLRLYS
ncbi:MAG: A24 family peptidase [Thermoleophilia bacterium]